MMISVLVGIFIIIPLREIKPEYAVISSILLGVYLLLQVMPVVGDVLGFTSDLMSFNIGNHSFTILYKAVGASFLCQYISELCRDCGLESVASKTEMFGKIYLTSLCIPLIDKILDTINVF